MLRSLQKLTWLKNSYVVFMKSYFVALSPYVTSKLQQENNDGQHHSKSDCLFYSLPYSTCSRIWCHMEICFLAVRVWSCVLYKSLFLIKGIQKSKNKSSDLLSFTFLANSGDNMPVIQFRWGKWNGSFQRAEQKGRSHVYRIGAKPRGRPRTC